MLNIQHMQLDLPDNNMMTVFVTSGTLKYLIKVISQLLATPDSLGAVMYPYTL